MKSPTYLAQVKGSVPEQFVFITVHGGHSSLQRMSFVSEPVLRELFRTSSGLTAIEIELRIKQARARAV